MQFKSDPEFVDAITEIADFEACAWQVDGIVQALSQVERGEKLVGHDEVFSALRKSFSRSGKDAK